MNEKLETREASRRCRVILDLYVALKEEMSSLAQDFNELQILQRRLDADLDSFVLWTWKRSLEGGEQSEEKV